MKESIIYFSMLIMIVSACKQDIVKEPIVSAIEDAVMAPFRIEILDDEALGVIDPSATLEVLSSGYVWSEGPLWVESESFLLFSDVPTNKIYKLDADGDTSVYLNPSGLTSDAPLGRESGSNGLMLAPNGDLVILQHGDRRVVRMDASLADPDESYITLTDNYNGQRFNSPNDGVYDQAGNLYFTDPPYGLDKMMDDPAKEILFQGVYCLEANGELKLVDTLSRPNGLALSPDGDELYVAVSDPNHAVWYTYDITAPGEVMNKEVFYDVTAYVGTSGHKGLPDGLKINSKGYMFATGPAGIWIFNLQGKALAKIHTGQATSNCALGHDEKNLYMTADGYILSVPLL